MFALFCLDTWQEEEAAWRTCFPARSELFLSNVVIMRPEGHTGPTSRLLLAPASTNTSKRMADMTVAKEIKNHSDWIHFALKSLSLVRNKTIL